MQSITGFERVLPHSDIVFGFVVILQLHSRLIDHVGFKAFVGDGACCLVSAVATFFLLHPSYRL